MIARRWREWMARIAGAWRARRHEADFADEVRTHLELLAAEHERRGLAPADAWAAARREFGGVTQIAESYREQRGLPFIDTATQDLRYAVRLWRRAPGFSALVVLVLALGIGANSAMFTFVNALLFRPLAGRAAELVGLYSHDPTKPNSYRVFSYPNYVDVRDRNDVFDGLIAYTFAMVGRPAGDVTRRSFVELVSHNFFDTIGVRLAAGRPFLPQEDHPGTDVAVAIASYASWRAAGLDPSFVGRTVRVNERDFTIVGVAPEGFAGTTALVAPELWLPLGVFDSVVNDIFKNDGRGQADRANASLMVAGRLKPGVTVDQANARLADLARDLERAYPAENARQLLSVHALSRVNIASEPSSDAGPAVFSAVVMPLAAAVLVIACLNIANMLLARATTRKKEIAIRLALGGSRGRLVRQLFTESLLLALIGAAGGLAMGSWITRLFLASVAQLLPLPVQFDPRPDANIVLMTTAFGVLSALAFGLAPALQSSRPNLVDDLKDLGGTRHARRPLGPRSWLVVCQIAVSLVLITAGGLFARAALRASDAEPGYHDVGVLLVSIDPSLAGYKEQLGREKLRAALEQLRHLPGVMAVGANSQVPFGDVHEGRPIIRPGRQDQSARNPTYTIATAGYFEAIGLAVRRGRDFTSFEEASPSGPRVAIIDEPLARAMFPGEDPIGQVLVSPPRDAAQATADNAPMTIVGVVPGIRDELFDRDPTSHVYVPSGSHYRAAMHLHVRVTPGAEAQMLGAIRRELRGIDERLPVVELRTMRDFHDRSVVLWLVRSAGRTLTGLGLLALLLAAIGVYGVKAYVVSQRTREIGIRLAMGARPGNIAWMLFRDGATLTLLGVAIGLPVAIGVSRLLSVAMFEVTPFDPIVLTLAPLVLITAAAVATWLPARRGMRISPLEALRTE